MEDANSAAIGHDDDRLSEAKRGHFAILRARAINLIPTLPHLQRSESPKGASG